MYNIVLNVVNIILDEMEYIQSQLIYLCDDLKVDLILTNGGIGFSKRDVTPEVTNNVIERYVPGFVEIIRKKSFKITPNAILSRAVSGIRKNTLIINLPGSPKGAIENLQFIIESIPHGIKILKGESSKCGQN